MLSTTPIKRRFKPIIQYLYKDFGQSWPKNNLDTLRALHTKGQLKIDWFVNLINVCQIELIEKIFLASLLRLHFQVQVGQVEV